MGEGGLRPGAGRTASLGGEAGEGELWAGSGLSRHSPQESYRGREGATGAQAGRASGRVRPGIYAWPQDVEDRGTQGVQTQTELQRVPVLCALGFRPLRALLDRPTLYDLCPLLLSLGEPGASFVLNKRERTRLTPF